MLDDSGREGESCLDVSDSTKRLSLLDVLKEDELSYMKSFANPAA